MSVFGDYYKQIANAKPQQAARTIAGPPNPATGKIGGISSSPAMAPPNAGIFDKIRFNVHNFLVQKLGIPSTGGPPPLREVPQIALRSVKPSLANIANAPSVRTATSMFNLQLPKQIKNVPVLGDIAQAVASSPYEYLQSGRKLLQEPSLRNLAGLTGRGINLALLATAPKLPLGGKQLADQGFRKTIGPLLSQSATKIGAPYGVGSAASAYGEGATPFEAGVAGLKGFAGATAVGLAVPMSSFAVRKFIERVKDPAVIKALLSEKGYARFDVEIKGGPKLNGVEKGDARGWVQRAAEQGKEFTVKLAKPIKSQKGFIRLGKQAVQEPAEEVSDEVKRLTAALKLAGPARKGQEALYRAERAKRFGAAETIRTDIGGEAGFYAEKGALKGPLPKLQLEPVRQVLTQQNVDNLFNEVTKSSRLTSLETFRAREGLVKLLAGEVPQTKELQLIERVFGSDLTKTLLDKRPVIKKLFDAAGQLFSLPRSIIASVDFSATLRQGVFSAVRYPKQFGSAFKNQFRYFASEKAFGELMDNIRSRPTYRLMEEFKLPITDLGRNVTAREEAFLSNLAERIPVLGSLVRASGRAYTGFLNKFRADVFDSMVKDAAKVGAINGEEIGGEFVLKSGGEVVGNIANFVGAATGRGSLGALEKAGGALSTALFSPRLIASRLTLMNPYYYARLDPFVRRKALESLFSFVGAGLSVLGLAKLAGAEVGTDPRSSDFGKIKIGNTRMDIWGGFQQYIKTLAQITSGTIVSSTSGKEYKLGEGYKPLTKYDLLLRTAEYKTQPLVSLAIDLLKGSSAVTGEPIDLKSEGAKLFIPLVMQDLSELFKEQGIKGFPLAVPPIFGVGTQTYGNVSDTRYKQRLNELEDIIKSTRNGNQSSGQAQNEIMKLYSK